MKNVQGRSHSWGLRFSDRAHLVSNGFTIFMVTRLMNGHFRFVTCMECSVHVVEDGSTNMPNIYTITVNLSTNKIY